MARLKEDLMLEAQACGKPIVAFVRGGASEIVSDGVTGILFENQTANSLCDAVTRCERMHFDSVAIRSSALHFNGERFHREFSQFVKKVVESWF